MITSAKGHVVNYATNWQSGSFYIKTLQLLPVESVCFLTLGDWYF